MNRAERRRRTRLAKLRHRLVHSSRGYRRWDGRSCEYCINNRIHAARSDELAAIARQKEGIETDG